MATPLPPDLSSVVGLVASRRDEAPDRQGAFVVALDGAVAVGKSTTAGQLAERLEVPPEALDVHVVSTDGFLFPNRVLDARGLTMRKGFPESYDHDAIEELVRAARRGDAELRVPVYSHETYDVLDETDVFPTPQVVVLEGLHTCRLAAAVDLTVYVDAAEPDVERWYVERFVELSAVGTGFYAPFAAWPEDRLLEFARSAWDLVNRPNLVENILPNRDRADVVVTKGPDHAVTAVTLRD